MEKQQAIDRDTYRQIKKMSREELNDFLMPLRFIYHISLII